MSLRIPENLWTRCNNWNNHTRYSVLWTMQTHDIDALIEDKKEQLTTLEEYKKSIIYEYVTGKKEVPDDFKD